MKKLSFQDFYLAAADLLTGSFDKVIFFQNDTAQIWCSYVAGTSYNSDPDFICQFNYSDYRFWNVYKLAVRMRKVFYDTIEDNERQFGPVNTF